MEGLCDWCQSEEKSGDHSKMSPTERKEIGGRSEYPSEDNKISKHKERVESSDRGGRKINTVKSTPSPRPAGRRYKLLKDVLC